MIIGHDGELNAHVCERTTIKCHVVLAFVMRSVLFKRVSSSFWNRLFSMSTHLRLEMEVTMVHVFPGICDLQYRKPAGWFSLDVLNILLPPIPLAISTIDSTPHSGCHIYPHEQRKRLSRPNS